ncbi:MAG: CHAP domain-containing protein [Candidatus Magasanikbacteria bacterium]
MNSGVKETPRSHRFRGVPTMEKFAKVMLALLAQVAKLRKFAAVIIVGVVLMMIAIAIHFLAVRAVEKEWKEKLSTTQRSPEEIDGIVANMVKYRAITTPAFVPKSLWDKEFCSATVVNAVSFISGGESLKTSAAWKFYATNRERLGLVYDRSADFVVQEDKILETYDRPVWLSRLGLQSDRIYVVGYRYHETLAVPRIVEGLKSGGTINSHVMLLLGRYDGSWWGYHLFHDPDRPNDSPFKVDNLGDDIPKKFDIVYIWEVLGVRKGGTPKNLLMVQNSPPYKNVARWTGLFGNNSLGRAVDSISAYLFTSGDNFPTVVDLDKEVVEIVKPGEKASHGQVLGFFRGVSVYQHAGASQRGEYGLEFQCVELANRFLVEALGHRNLTRTGDADSYFYQARGKGLMPYYNDGVESPRSGDVVVFDPEGDDNNPGHVAIVASVSESQSQICIVQQNTRRWYECLPLKKRGAKWHVENPTGLPCVGWARRIQK